MLAIPLFAYTLGGRTGLALVLMSSALATDFLDGFLARCLGIRSSSALEAYADPVADVMIVLGGFGALALRGLFPPWIVPALLAAFLQFVLTSSRRAPVYDPLGKYSGCGLFVIFMGVVLFPKMSRFALMCVVGLIVFSVAGRGIHLWGRRRWLGTYWRPWRLGGRRG